MFENLLGQAASDQLIEDIESGTLAPAMLFSGPPASGKGTSALELGRIISCEADPQNSGSGRAAWNCTCPACSRHRLLVHPDLLCLGHRSFAAEIAASAGAFQRETGSAASRILFIRSIRKLLARFNPAFWEDDSRGRKVASLVDIVRDNLDDFEALTSAANPNAGGKGDAGQSPAEKTSLDKVIEGLMKNAFKLESEGMGETIPIAQLRRSAFWCHLAPQGRGKLLLIENADRMQDEARNSLLKLLEEPPPRVTLVLTTPRPGSLLLTIRSRLRPYRFNARGTAVEGEVIRRVFRDDAGKGGAGRKGEGDTNGLGDTESRGSIEAYLDSFLPVSRDTLEALAAFFAASAAYKAALLSRKSGRPLPDEVVLLGKHTAPRAEAAGLGRPQGDGSAVTALIIEKADKFEIRSLFSRFLHCLLEQVAESQKQGVSAFLPRVAYNEIWREASAWAETAAVVYKLRPLQVLEKLFTDLSRRMAEL